MPTEFYCGNPICKRPVTLAEGVEPSWPIRHDCGAWLYPEDLMEKRTARDEALHPDPAPIRRLKDGRLVDTNSSDFRVAPTPQAAVDARPIAPPRPNRTGWLVAAALAIIALAAALVMLR
jgi:hypothetical protein